MLKLSAEQVKSFRRWMQVEAWAQSLLEPEAIRAFQRSMQFDADALYDRVLSDRVPQTPRPIFRDALDVDDLCAVPPTVAATGSQTGGHRALQSTLGPSQKGEGLCTDRSR